MDSKNIATDYRIYALITAFIINAFLWIYIWKVYSVSSDIIPLHTSIYFGIDVLDSKSKLFIIPFGALFFLIVDAILAYLIQKKERLISIILIIAGCALQILTFIASALLVKNI